MHPITKWLQTNKIVAREGKTRWYSVLGSPNWVPSVTSILSAADKGEYFQKWLANQGSWENACKVRDTAANRGTLVHEISEDLLNGEEIVLDAEADIIKRIMCLEQWYNDYQPEVIMQEIMLAFPGIRYAGRFDILARIDGKNVLIDIKTGGYYKSHDLQATMYKVLWDTIVEHTDAGQDYMIDEMYGLYLNDKWKKKPNPTFKQLKFLPDVVEGTVNLWYWLNSDYRGNAPRPKESMKLPTNFKLGVTQDELENLL